VLCSTVAACAFPLQRFTGQALGIATGMVASIEGQAEAARTRGREKAAEEVSVVCDSLLLDSHQQCQCRWQGMPAACEGTI
jgi:hypothetical protein